MNKKFILAGLIASFMIVLAACGGGDKPSKSSSTSGSNGDSAQSQVDNTGTSETRTIEYLGEQYTVPQKAEKIVIGAMEAMEDAVMLDVHPVGAISVGGKFPEMFASVTDKAESIGEKRQPNLEKILQLEPDVILGSTKFPKGVVEKLQKIAPTILVSHVSTNWEDNLKLMGELTGKQGEAEKILSQYKTDTQAVKASLKEKLQGKKVATVRIRGGQTYIFAKNVDFNPFLYNDIGLEMPEQIGMAKLQDAISVEQLAEMNPDYLFVQFSMIDNKDAENAFEDLKKNPIIQNINAFKLDHVYVNVVDPLMEGGPVYSRIKFLESVQKYLNK
ncbi:ABC transporter substrate-binding protein [Lysinibacillus agricola]|uniref:ABC transporter substrate-binding protein n=1 Tax=Lysinibacillus agricola TaxID=2590012 RepID=A0ABX7AMB8_9BACI|nr:MULTISPECIES: ABC transporter substrate-binding protein [Lysinibacillus]KOS59837.1 iron-uptake system-binding protein [Lysinibacillus sp. FJAT-14222]QQP10616.1 ABC transporter substrate-binding protein [Lysinibacillus agricola]